MPIADATVQLRFEPKAVFDSPGRACPLPQSRLLRIISRRLHHDVIDRWDEGMGRCYNCLKSLSAMPQAAWTRAPEKTYRAHRRWPRAGHSRHRRANPTGAPHWALDEVIESVYSGRMTMRLEQRMYRPEPAAAPSRSVITDFHLRVAQATQGLAIEHKDARGQERCHA